MGDTDERRRAERVTVPVRFFCKQNAKKGDEQECRCGSLSGSGAKLISGEALGVGKKIHLSMQFPTDPCRIQTVSRVVWCRDVAPGEFHVGVHFVKIENNDRFLDLLCSTVLEKGGDS